MGYVLLYARADLQVLSTTLVLETERCTIETTPSGVILDYQVPRTSFDADQGAALLSNLATDIENLISGGLAIGGYGEQSVDPATQLLVDNVVFTVSYQPPQAGALPLTTTVAIPVNIVTADPAFSSGLTGGSAAERLQAAYASMQALAAG